MRHIVKKIYDISNNRKLTITVDPSSKLNNDQMSKRFYPSNESEVYFYESEEIIPTPNKQEGDENYYYYNNYPSNEVYSVLKPTVYIGDNPLDTIDINDIVSGIKPKIESVTYTKNNLKSLPMQYGLVYRNEFYKEIMDSVSNDMFTEIYAKDEQTVSINRERSIQDHIFVIKGRVLQEESSYYMSDSGTSIEGKKFHSPNLFDIDYYNDTIIPDKIITTTSGNKGKLTVKNPSSLLPDVVEDRLLQTSKTTEKYQYQYEGIDPLISEIEKTSEITIPFGINKSKYKILAFLKNESQIGTIQICNMESYNINNEGHPFTTKDVKTFGYSEYEDDKSFLTFYRQRESHQERWEDAIQLTYNGIVFTYPLSKGLGSFDTLTRIMMVGDSAKTCQYISDNSPAYKNSTQDKFTIQMGGKLYSLKTMAISASNSLVPGASTFGDMNAYDITKLLKAKIGLVKTMSSQTTHSPVGRNKSVNITKSRRVTETCQDFDSRNAIGGGLQYKTEVQPDSMVRIVLGDTGLVKNINVPGTFANKGELEIVADNFYENHKSVVSITLTTKGFIDAEKDLDKYLNVDNNFVIDKITYDYASNGSIIQCRTITDKDNRD